ncbi:MAG: hypothetical protein HKN89_08625 [Eudoraea sp.]|nr:hypothetical protein [Eudoraea sp.]
MMNDMRLRPKSDYLKTANWEQLYVLCEHWRDDMGFYLDELKFFQKLINKYFLWLAKDENVAKAEAIFVDVKKGTLEAKWLEGAICEHMRHISDLMKNAFSRDAQEFRQDHAVLEDKMVEFTKLFRKLKAEVFAVTEYIMETEDLPARMPYKERS